MDLSNNTIRTKVFMAFGLVLVITLALGGFAITRLAQVNAEASQIRKRWLPATQIIARMSLSFEQYRIAA
jgi:methyl-accepting chemotaxis protein